MELVTDTVRDLLREKGMGHLEVFEGNCTGRTMVWVRRPPAALGSPTPLTEDELNVLDAIFGEVRARNGPTFSYGVWKAQAAMALGLRSVQPMCRLCGQVFEAEDEVEQCVRHHMESGQK